MKYCALIVILALAAVPCAGQQTVTEPSTGKTFPGEVTIKSGESSYTLHVTGVAVRKKFFFKVYGMAHYMQDPVLGSKQDVLKSILVDGPAKQINMIFVRNVDVGKIQETYREGFNNNTNTDERKSISPLVDAFVSYFTKDVKENDEFILRWLPGGVVQVSVQGEAKPPITDLTFARVLWSIWFGEDSIVDREDLIKEVGK